MQKSQKPQKRPTWLVSEGRVFHGVRTPRAFVWTDSGLPAEPPAPPSPKRHLTGLLRAANLAPRDHAKYQAQLDKLSAEAMATLSERVRQARARRSGR